MMLALLPPLGQGIELALIAALTCWLLRVLLALVPLDGAAVWFSAGRRADHSV
jgi:hypothetical protein